MSVIVPAYNATATLRAQLDAFCAQDIAEPWELIVVDNGSDDGTGELARAFQDRLPLRVVRHDERGINEARNRGVTEARSDRLVFADADDIVGPGYVRTMAAAIGEDTIVGGWVERWHLEPDPERKLDDGPISAIYSGEWLPYPIGCCCALHRAVFERIGGFDTDIRYGGDDIDLFWRAQLDGARLIQAPEGALVIRRERADPARLRAQAGVFGRAEATLARRYESHGHPGRLRRRAWFRALRFGALAATSKGPARLETTRRAAYHGAAAHQLARYALRLEATPPPARVHLARREA